MSQAETLIGQTLQGTYRLERLLGEGGHGAVYEAAHVRLMRRFAIKLLHGDYQTNREALQRFEREAMVTSALDHPNIIDVTDFNYSAEGYPYLVMELLAGEDLERRQRRQGRLEVLEALPILSQICAALTCAHAREVTHRDLKPQNVFLATRPGGDAETVKVLDFGISKMVGLDTLTTTGALIGTPFYMAPEQVDEASGNTDVRTDVYAVGAIAYQLLVGRPPLVAERLTALLYKIAHTIPEPAAAVAPVPTLVSDVIARALAKAPGDRYATAQALIDALRCAAGMVTGPNAYPPVTGPLTVHSGPLRPLDSAVTGPTMVAETSPPIDQPALSSSTLSTSVGEKHARVLAAAEPAYETVTEVAPVSRRRSLMAVALGGAVVGIAAVAVATYVGLFTGEPLPPGLDGRSLAAGASTDAVVPDAGAAEIQVDAAADAAATEPAATDAAAPVRIRKPRRARPRRRRPTQRRRPKPVKATRPANTTPKRCTMRVTTLVDGVSSPAKVYVDGKLVGESPVIVPNLACGYHRVTIIKSGFVKISRRLSIEPGQRNPLRLNLRK